MVKLPARTAILRRFFMAKALLPKLRSSLDLPGEIGRMVTAGRQKGRPGQRNVAPVNGKKGKISYIYTNQKSIFI
jgi:hypothetical protein